MFDDDLFISGRSRTGLFYLFLFGLQVRLRVCLTGFMFLIDDILKRSFVFD